MGIREVREGVRYVGSVEMAASCNTYQEQKFLVSIYCLMKLSTLLPYQTKD